MEARGPNRRRGTLGGWFVFWLLSPVILSIAAFWGMVLFVRGARRRGSLFPGPSTEESVRRIRTRDPFGQRPPFNLSISEETWKNIIEEDARLKGDQMIRSLEDEEPGRGS